MKYFSCQLCCILECLAGFLLSFPALSQNPGYNEAIRLYIDKYRDIAVKEMMVYRIPASITLAQGIFESNAGKSKLAVEANNHFGIKCHKEWNGKTYFQDDETKNECFRKYDTPEESFRDHSSFLKQRERYRSLFTLNPTDYKAWAHGLKKAGYATNPKYAELLIKHIERYQLYRFDNPNFSMAFEDSIKNKSDTSDQKKAKARQLKIISQGPGNHVIYAVNGVSLIIAMKGDTWESVSKQFSLSERKLFKCNDLKNNARLVPGQMVFLEMKRKKGAAAFHLVDQGETMYTIAQTEGIQLKHLYKKNKMKPGTPVKPGKKLLLR